jgi:hypothetical protein
MSRQNQFVPLRFYVWACSSHLADRMALNGNGSEPDLNLLHRFSGWMTGWFIANKDSHLWSWWPDDKRRGVRWKWVASVFLAENWCSPSRTGKQSCVIAHRIGAISANNHASKLTFWTIFARLSNLTIPLFWLCCDITHSQKYQMQSEQSRSIEREFKMMLKTIITGHFSQ